MADRLRAADPLERRWHLGQVAGPAPRTDADAAGKLDWLVAVEFPLVRVHQHGTNARRVGGNAATVSVDDPEGQARAGQRAGCFFE